MTKLNQSTYNIGLRQAKVLCQMSRKERLRFISDGLPVILQSVQGYWQASHKLKNHPREASVLLGHATEEAAKILILMDAIRCPDKIVSSKIGNIVSWFYNHLARLIYAEAVYWKPTNTKELREYVDRQRLSHSVDGQLGEFIFPNWSLYTRESQLYADVFRENDQDPSWQEPSLYLSEITYFKPLVIELTEAMSVLGMFKYEGLVAISETWDKTTFSENEDFKDARDLTRLLLDRLIEEGLPTEDANQTDAEVLFHNWQLPMYDFDFNLINVSIEELNEEQDRMLYSEIGW